MARTTVYRQVTAKRRTSTPRMSAGAGLSTSFGRMLAKLAFASGTLSSSRPRYR